MPGEHAESDEDAKACGNQEKVERHGGVGETLGCALYEHGGMRSRTGVRMPGEHAESAEDAKACGNHCKSREKAESERL